MRKINRSRINRSTTDRSRIKRNFTPVVLPVLSLLLVMASVYASFVGQSVTPAVAAAPQGPSAPQQWIEPINVSNEAWYDNTSSIAASPLNGAVTVAWEQRDERDCSSGPCRTFGQILHASNDIVGGQFNVQTVQRAAWKEIGNVEVEADSQGRRHMVYFKYNGSNSTCGGYAIVDANGNLVSTEVIPNSCNGFYKPTALAMGSDDTAHILLDGTTTTYATSHATRPGLGRFETSSLPTLAAQTIWT